MINRLLQSVFVIAVCLLLPQIALSQSVSNLTITKSGNDAILAWSTGTGPFRVISSTSPVFTTGNRLLAEGIPAGPWIDVGANDPSKPHYFYQVVSIGSGESNPGLYDYNPPRPVPNITSLSPNTGRPGDTVTIYGTDFPVGGSLGITFGTTLVTNVISSTETQIDVEVPAETTTGDVVICNFDVCSNAVLFTVPVGQTFLDISSLAYEGTTGSLWLGDRDTDDKVYEIDTSNVSNSRASRNQAIISNATPSDGTGRIYYSNSLDDSNNVGTISYVNSSNNTTGTFRTAGATGDPVYCRGLAADTSVPNVVFFLDGLANTVRRVPLTGTKDTNWGNTVFTFNNPAGARLDSSGNLYVSSMTAVYKISPTEVVTMVASGFSGAAGIDLSEESGTIRILVADKAAGSIYLVDPETGDKDALITGLTNPIAAVFSENPTTGEVYYDVATTTRVYRFPDPTVDFAIKKGNVPVLMKAHRKDGLDTYPNTTFQTQDRKIMVRAVYKDPLPKAGVTLYFRIHDPGDPNKGGSGSISPESAVTDANGMVETELTVTNQYGGDDYEIEVSKTQTPFKKIGKSATYVAWKRGYVEYRKMYKSGQFLTQDSGAGAPFPERIYVPTPSAFTVGETVHVLGGASSDNTQNRAEGETCTVTDATAPDYIVVSPPLARLYPGPNTDGAPYCFVAHDASGAYDSHPNMGTSYKAYAEAFVQWLLVDATGYVPFFSEIPGTDLTRPSFLNDISARFFKNYSYDNLAAKPNHILLVAGAYYDSNHTTLGQTESDDSLSNCSWAFWEEIANDPGTSNLQNVLDDVNAHEQAHQWNVNPPPNPACDPQHPNCGHCLQNASSGGRSCLMNESRNKNLPGVANFHDNTSAPTDDLFCIRCHPDDLSVDTCSCP